MDIKMEKALSSISDLIKKSYRPRNNQVVSECFHVQIRNRKRDEIMKYIEDIMISIHETEMSGQDPTIEVRDRRNWNNCIFNEILRLKPIGEASINTIDVAKKCSKAKFIRLVLLLSKIYKMLQSNTKCTRRELYYQNIAIIKNQSTLDEAVRDVCTLLDVPPWELGIMATSKGLVAGDLDMMLADGSIIHCQSKSGILIPQDVMEIQEITSNAKFILVVEKDAIFQKLLDDDILTRLGPILMITGKGFPDINTRLLLKRLWLQTLLPMFAVVDADAYGIEIMCVYRFGSLAMSHESENLAVPSLRWIGVHPRDIEILSLPSIPLTNRECLKLNRMKLRPYMTDDIKKEINILIETKRKTEIEALTSLGNVYITDVYLPQKICSMDFS